MDSDHSSVAFARAVGDGWARLVRGAAHGEVLLLPGGSLGIGGEAFGEMNWADIVGPDGGDEAMRAFVRRLRERGLPGTITALPELAAELAPVATELGLAADPEPMPLMRCRAEDAPVARPPAPGVEVRRVTGRDETPGVALVLAEAFECPLPLCEAMLGPDLPAVHDVAFFAATVDGEPAGSVGTARVGDCVGIYAVGTRPALRRRGVAATTLVTAMSWYVPRGVRTFGLHASAAGAPVYSGLGFELVAEVASWLVPT